MLDNLFNAIKSEIAIDHTSDLLKASIDMLDLLESEYFNDAAARDVAIDSIIALLNKHR